MNVIDHSADVVAVDDGLATRAIIAGGMLTPSPPAGGALAGG